MSKLWGAILMVVGTTIGAGILALPVVSGLSGFFPSSFVLLCVWLLMSYTAFLVLELSLRFPGKNIFSMAQMSLGYWGRFFSVCSYLFLLYLLMIAYLSEGSRMFHLFIGGSVPLWLCPLPFLILLGTMTYCGYQAVDRFNRLLMLGLFGSFFLLCFFLLPQLHIERLTYTKSSFALCSLSLVSTAFGFHIIIPSLVSYLEGELILLKKALVIGISLPFVIYILWNALFLSFLPLKGEGGLEFLWERGLGVSAALEASPFFALAALASMLTFFAILSSFLGVSLSLFDFLSDAFGKSPWNRRSIILLCTFFPPLIVLWINPSLFLAALNYAGAFGVVVLLAFLPALMLWKLRHQKASYVVPGGFPALLAVMLFSLGITLFECIKIFYGCSV